MPSRGWGWDEGAHAGSGVPQHVQPMCASCASCCPLPHTPHPSPARSAAPGGMGGTKAAGNYSPVLVTQLAAKKEGYSDVVYLDAKTDT